MRPADADRTARPSPREVGLAAGAAAVRIVRRTSGAPADDGCRRVRQADTATSSPRATVQGFRRTAGGRPGDRAATAQSLVTGE